MAVAAAAALPVLPAAATAAVAVAVVLPPEAAAVQVSMPLQTAHVPQPQAAGLSASHTSLWHSSNSACSTQANFSVCTLSCTPVGSQSSLRSLWDVSQCGWHSSLSSRLRTFQSW